MRNYAFTGANMPPEMIEQRRALARAMMQANNRTPQNVGEGLHAVGRAIAARLANSQADRAQMRAERDAFLVDAKEARAAAPEMAAEAPVASGGADPRLAVAQALQGGAGADALAGGRGADMLLPRDPASLPPQVALGPHTMGAQDMIGREGGYGGPAGPQYPDDPMAQMAPSPGMLPQGPAMPPPLPSVGAPDMPSRGEVRGLSNPADPALMGEAQYARDFERQPVGKDDRTRRQSAVPAEEPAPTPEQLAQMAQAVGISQEALQGMDLNATESRNLGLLLRMMEAEADYRRFEPSNTWGQRALELIPGQAIESMLMDPDYRRLLLSRENFNEAALRAATGATINDSELPRQRQNYFPLPSDDEQTRQMLERQRQALMMALAAGSGPASAILPQFGDPVVPRAAPARDLSTMSDEELLRALQGGN